LLCQTLLAVVVSRQPELTVEWFAPVAWVVLAVLAAFASVQLTTQTTAYLYLFR